MRRPSQSLEIVSKRLQVSDKISGWGYSARFEQFALPPRQKFAWHLSSLDQRGAQREVELFFLLGGRCHGLSPIKPATYQASHPLHSITH
jgi:hypothetical protein